jgi:glycosyltransferase involved in cell wall biosynthesis
MSEIILSVIIPSYNSAAFLEECLKSVEREGCEGVEFILMDGASSDATMEIVERFRHLFSKIVSEPDGGQSDAFNQGFTLAKGRFLTWLNSDDVICSGSMATTLPVLRGTTKDWLVANSVYLDEAGHVTRCCRSGGFEHFAVKRGLLNVFGPSTFFSKKLFEELGGIDESYHFAMDTEYWWRIVGSGRTYQRINCYFWGLRLHSAAKTANVLLTGEYPAGMREEGQKIAQRYFPEVSQSKRARAVQLVRIWRIMNLSYVFSIIDTLRLRGKRL